MRKVKFVRLTKDYKLDAFDCGNADLNDFLYHDALAYQSNLLSETYIMEIDGRMVAYFSLLHDKIAIPDSDRPTWRRIKALFPHRKHRGDYPALKIGRLAVDKNYRGLRIGSKIINFIGSMFLSNRRAGCAFLTVDALKDAVPFYLKNGFNYLKKTDSEKELDTYLMFFNLQQLL